ncbi:ABC transporter ATP-binding protein [Corynebacterium kutscheri]|uniref:ABC transporter ATP-binding protein n=1 Tax=Corynebacterium kutscheri TaxID=35755 RepID=A0AB38VVE4_9CORY|nr:ABC transporter ATP-binding protein [Corynebacterium kutscheri]VEH06735.1 ABC transporter ATP-binding protein [Corynebacterium kutscheri]VEH79309.1 ABC transporter ATP-binding protein [Corynebacterium kutscheri]
MLLKVDNLSVYNVVDQISFAVEKGQRVGLIGESGSGKTLTALSIMRLVESRGHIRLGDTALSELSETQLCSIRGKRVAMVFQEPMTALNPLMKVGRQVLEAIQIHARGSKTQALALFKAVELDESLYSRYPHELSGGQRQRIIIAMALAHNPELLICDEPTTALDVTSQKAIVDLIIRLVEEREMGLLFITHDLGLVARTCERIIVMRNGIICEQGSTDQVLKNPHHEYTRALISASILPSTKRDTSSNKVVVEVNNVSKIYRKATAVRDVSLTVSKGQRMGIIGGSGSGKTTLLNMIAGLSTPTQGSIHTQGKIQMVFQDPYSCLDPRMRIREIIAEPLDIVNDERIDEVLREVGLDPQLKNRFPHEFSGGQRQRIALARALAPRPDILLADEPVSALDISVRKTVLELLDKLVTEHGLSLIFVSHDIHVVRSVCTQVTVMHHGEIVEEGHTSEVLHNPQHAYTRQLIDAVPTLS